MGTGLRRSAHEVIAASRVLPLVVLDDARSARRVGETLSAGGINVAEVAFRTPGSIAALREIAADTDLCVGAGTVVTVDQVDLAVAAGAAFVVTPGLSAAVVGRCRELSVPVFPGAATATEVTAAIDLGIEVLKFFPAEALGGTRMISALAGPFPQMRFIPTGGVTAANAASYLAHPSVLAVGGSWMIPADLVRDGQWGRLTELAHDAAAAVRTVGSPA